MPYLQMDAESSFAIIYLLLYTKVTLTNTYDLIVLPCLLQNLQSSILLIWSLDFFDNANIKSYNETLLDF